MVTADKQNGEWTLLSQVIHNRAHEHGLSVEEAKRWWRGRLAPGELKVRWLLDKVSLEIEKDGKKEKLLRFYRSDHLTADFWGECRIDPIFSLAVHGKTSLQGVEVYVPHLVEDSEPAPAADQTAAVSETEAVSGRRAARPEREKGKRGPKPAVMPRLLEEMGKIETICLAGMKHEEMASVFKASADTCKKARDIVLGNSR